MGEGSVKVVAGPGRKISNCPKNSRTMIQLECLLYCTEEMLSGNAFHGNVFHFAM